LQIFLTNSKRDAKSNPSSPSNDHSQAKEEVCTTLAQSFTKRYHQKSFAHERYQIAKVGHKFQPLFFSQWESYDKK